MSTRRILRTPCPAWLVSLFLLAPACVLPVGPQFEDPPSNSAPYLASSDPPAGAILPASSPQIEIVLGDANQDDVLVGRWFIDYPPFDASVTRLAHEFRLPSSGKSEREEVRFVPDCGDDQIAPGMASHRVSLSVADRPFLHEDRSPPDLRLDSVSPEGFVLRATWLLNLECP